MYMIIFIVTAQTGIMNCQIECRCDSEGSKVTSLSLRSRTHEVQGNGKGLFGSHSDNYVY